MCETCEELKKRFDTEIASLSRQFAHAVMDLDAAITVVGTEASRRLKSIEERLAPVERKVMKLEVSANG